MSPSLQWTARLTMKFWRRLGRKILVTALLIGMMAGAALSASQSTPSLETQRPMSPLRPAPPGLSAAEIFAKLLEHNRLRDTELRRYSAMRTYQVSNAKGKLYAEEVVQMSYQSPDSKDFSVTYAQGSRLVRDLVLKRLIEAEARASSGREHRNTSIKPSNYTFQLLGEQDLGTYHCYVVESIPKRKDKHLFAGRVWIDSRDYAVVRIAGHPAAKISFWVEKVNFVRQYQRLGEFWLPLEDKSVVTVRFAGKKILTIDHGDYTINGHVPEAHQAAGQHRADPSATLSLDSSEAPNSQARSAASSPRTQHEQDETDESD
jgi:hypothetical protein